MTLILAMNPASFPSPSSGTISIGPLNLTAYGLCIALGVLVGAWLLGRRFEEKGLGTGDDLSSIVLGAVLAGVVGARLYHVATDWEKFENNLSQIPKIWEGGLGIPGGVLLGTLVGLWLAHRRGLPLGITANAAAPALPLSQAIGRFGNYFNQELYGRPTDLPWALEIDDDNLVAGYTSGTTFHPTFLYESLWNLALCGLLLLVDRRFTVRPWQLFAMYVSGYGVGRFWIEGLRIDEAKEFGGLRLNQWMALILVVGGVLYLLWSTSRPAPAPSVAGAGEGAIAGTAVAGDETALGAIDEEATPVGDSRPHLGDVDDVTPATGVDLLDLADDDDDVDDDEPLDSSSVDDDEPPDPPSLDAPRS